MTKLAIATVVSSDEYQFYLPLFTFCAHRAYPYAAIKVFVCGKLDPDSRPFIHGKVYENMFEGYQEGESTYNAMRQLLPAKYFEGCDYLYSTDADFLMFKQKVSHMDYYAAVMDKIQQPIACARGPLRGLAATRLDGYGWTENRTRIAAGCIMQKIPEWFEATSVARKYYRHLVKHQRADRFDSVPACTYREFDEVMIYRICKMSDLRTPDRKDHFLNGEKMNAIYRDIHLGDFKFKKRYHNPSKMKRILRNRNVKNYLELQNVPEWQRITDYVSGKSGTIRRMLKKLDKYVSQRLRQG